MLYDGPWQRVETDLSHFKNNYFIFTVDYYSRYIDFVKHYYLRICYASQEYKYLLLIITWRAKPARPHSFKVLGSGTCVTTSTKLLIHTLLYFYAANTLVHNRLLLLRYLWQTTLDWFLCKFCSLKPYTLNRILLSGKNTSALYKANRKSAYMKLRSYPQYTDMAQSICVTLTDLVKLLKTCPADLLTLKGCFRNQCFVTGVQKSLSSPVTTQSPEK